MRRIVVALLAALTIAVPGFWTAHIAMAAPTLVVNPQTNVQPGTYVNVSGSGFTPGSTVTLTFGSGFIASYSVPVNGSTSANPGTFSTQFQVPQGTQPGTYTITARDNSTNQTVESYVSVVAAGSPSLTLSPSTVQPGGTLTVTGSGFSPAAAGTTYTVYIQAAVPTANGTTTTTQPVAAQVNSTGQFSTAITVPSNAVAGAIRVYVTQQSGAGATLAETTGTVAASAGITISPTTVQPGAATSVTVTGTGFTPGETVTLTYTAVISGGTSAIQTQTVVADASGNFSIPIAVPQNTVPNTYQIKATGGTSGKTSTATFTVAPQPAITLAPSTAAPGTLVTVTGQLFTPNLPVSISATFPSSGGVPITVTNSATANATGSFTSTFNIPPTATSGQVTLTATQVQSFGTPITATGKLTIQGYQATIQVSPQQVTAGGIVTVAGAGFAPGPLAPVTVSATVAVNGVTQTIPVPAAVADVSASGTFTTQFIVPVGAAGSATVTATQVSSGATANGTFFVLGAATATPIPTATATPSPTPTPSPTATPLPTATPINTPVFEPTPTPSRPSGGALHFARLSLWYHAVHVGTFNHIEVQATPHRKLGIWVHVLFPTGIHFDYYEQTNAAGHWAKSFDIPGNSMSQYSTRAYVLLQLWKGKTSVKDYVPFVLLR